MGYLIHMRSRTAEYRNVTRWLLALGHKQMRTYCRWRNGRTRKAGRDEIVRAGEGKSLSGCCMHYAANLVTGNAQFIMFEML